MIITVMQSTGYLKRIRVIKPLYIKVVREGRVILIRNRKKEKKAEKPVYWFGHHIPQVLLLHALPADHYSDLSRNPIATSGKWQKPYSSSPMVR